MDSTHFSFSKGRLEAIPVPEKHTIYHDTHQKSGGLKLRVYPSGAKRYAVVQKLKGRTKFVSIGGFPLMTVEQARKHARELTEQIADGTDPHAKKRADALRQVTLQDCINRYIRSRSNIKDGTAKEYRQILGQYLQDWMDKPILKISRDMVETRHKKIGDTSPTRANKTMRVLRAVFEYAHGAFEDEDGNPLVLHNPVKRLSHVRAWYKEARRVDFIKPADLPVWWEAVNTIPDWLPPENQDPECIRDYLLFVLMTGLRRREAASLRKEWIDTIHKTLTIPSDQTKNGHAHSLPITDALDQLVSRRMCTKGPYVFGSSKSKAGYLQEPKRVVEHIRNRTEIYFTVHGLRRTFITIAESTGQRDYTLKRLLNHRSTGDVTDGYLMDDVERLRQPLSIIHSKIIALAKNQPNGNVVELNAAG